VNLCHVPESILAEEASEELKKVKTKYLNEIKFCLQEISD
jgi:hypothetical protein